MASVCVGAGLEKIAKNNIIHLLILLNCFSFAHPNHLKKEWRENK